MASHGSFYTTAGPPTPTPISPVSPAPPPPPPKPVSHSRTQSADPSRSSTPLLSATPTSASSQQQQQQTIPAINSPRPPPLPQTPQEPVRALTPATIPQPAQHSTIPPPRLEEQWLPPNVSSKPISELTPLLQKPELLSALASQHPSYASALEPLQSAIAANVALAQQVVNVEKQVAQLRDEMAQLLLNHTSLQTQWRRKQSEMDDALAPWGPRQMYQRLVSSINEQEALLKAVQESFLEGENPNSGFYAGPDGKASEKEVTEWVRRIKEGATILERRREMRARWDEGRVGGWR